LSEIFGGDEYLTRCQDEVNCGTSVNVIAVLVERGSTTVARVGMAEYPLTRVWALWQAPTQEHVAHTQQDAVKARLCKSKDGTDRRWHDKGSLVINQMGRSQRPCMRLGSVQLWRRRWSRRRSINRSVALQRGQCGVAPECFISPPVGTKRRGLQRRATGEALCERDPGRVGSGRERGSIEALRRSTQTGGVGS
jgi:hypothetical protein